MTGWKHTPGPIGLDLAGRWVKAAQLRPHAGSWRIHAFAHYERERDGPWTADDAALLASVLRRQGFEDRPMVLSAPRECVIQAAVTSNKNGVPPVSQLARLELARVGRCDPHRIECAFWAIPPGTRQDHAPQFMAVGLLTESLEPLLRLLDDAGLPVHAVDIRPAALHRALGLWSHAGEGLGVNVDINWDALGITVSQSDRIVFIRSLESLGAGSLLTGLSRRFDVHASDVLATLQAPPEQLEGARRRLAEACSPTLREFCAQVVAEVSRSVAYASQRHENPGDGTLNLTGDFAHAAPLAQTLGAGMGMQARSLTCADVLSPDSDAAPHPPHACLGAIGLAMHPVRTRAEVPAA